MALGLAIKQKSNNIGGSMTLPAEKRKLEEKLTLPPMILAIEKATAVLILKQRCKLNDMMIKESTAGTVPNFSFWGSVVLECTDLGEDDLNKYSTDEIIAIANAIFEVANKKK